MKTLSIWKTLLCSVMMLAMGAAFTACSEGDNPQPSGSPTMELSTTSLAFKNIPEGEQSFGITMTGSGYWKITGDVDKMTVSPLTGRSSATVKVLPSETAANRTMTLTVTLYMQMYGVEAEVSSATVRVTQTDGGGDYKPETNVKAIREKVDGWCPTKGATYAINEDLILTGIVVSDKDGGNTNARNVLLADDTTEPGAGIMIRAKKYPEQVRGNVVSVNLNGAVAQNYNGTMQVEFQEGGAAGGAATFTVIDAGDNMPEAIEVTDIKTLINYQSQYVKVKAQAKEADFGKMFYAGSENYCNYTFVTPTGASLPLQFSSYSKSWAGSIAIPEKSGYIKGCVGTYDGGNIAPQNAGDVAGLTEPLFEVEGGGDKPIVTDAIYYNNFDKEKAVKENNYYPNVTATDCFKNETGSGASAVTYDASSKTSVRPTMTSEGAAYGGSGVNAIFFGEDGGTFTIGNIAVAAENLKLTFGVSKASGSAFTAVPAGEFTVALSADGTNWSNNINYTLSGETDAWNLGTADFTLPAGTKTLYIKFTAAVKSVFRLDDVTLAAGNGGQQITFEGGNTPAEPTISAASSLSFVATGGDKELSYTAANLGENNVYAKIEGADAAQFSVTAPANGKVTVTAAVNETEAAKNATLVLYVAASEGGAAVASTNVALSQTGKSSQGGDDAKTLTISRSTIDTSAWTVNGYGSQNTSNLDTYMKWSISGIDFIGAKLCLPTAGKEYDKVNAFQGQGNASDGAKTCRLGNTVSMGKIKKITVVSYGTTYTPNFNLTVGTEQIVGTTIPSSMVGAANMEQSVEELSDPALKKYTNVYVPTTDAGFFAIYKNTSGALYFSEIIVEYE